MSTASCAAAGPRLAVKRLRTEAPGPAQATGAEISSTTSAVISFLLDRLAAKGERLRVRFGSREGDVAEITPGPSKRTRTSERETRTTRAPVFSWAPESACSTECAEWVTIEEDEASVASSPPPDTALCRHLVDSGSDLVLIASGTGPDAPLLYASSSALQTLRIDPESLPGRSLASLLHPDDVPRLAEALRPASRPPELDDERNTPRDSRPVELRLRRCNGSGEAIAASGRVGVAGSSAWVCLGEARRPLGEGGGDMLYRFAMDNVQDVISINSPDSTILYITPSAQQLFGLSPEEMVGRKGYEFVFPEDVEGTIRLSPWPADEGTMHGAFRIRHRDGSPRMVEYVTRIVPPSHGSPPRSGGAAAAAGHFVCVWRDVTEKRRAEEAERAAERERSAREAVSQYVAYTAHELRNPVQGILGMAQLLRDEVPEGAPAGYVESIVGCSGLVLALLNDVLDLGKLEAGRVELQQEDFSVRGAVETAVRVLAPYAREKGLQLDLEWAEGVPEAAAGDAARLGQVLTNLISNAIKFTRAGGVRVRVELDADETGAPGSPGEVRLRFRVLDTGVGIAPEHIPKLFCKYSQLRPAAVGAGWEAASGAMGPAKHSTGLGLAICKEIADLVGGSISVRSTLGAGSEFAFTCRLKPAEGGGGGGAGACPSERATPDRTLPAALRVLVAEDNPVIQLVLRRRLERLGCPCRVVGDGRSAVAEALAGAYDCVLMDVVMPEQDGLAATRAIRAAGCGVRVVGVTANTRAEDRAACFDAGMDEVLAKPFTEAQLRAALLPLAREIPASRPATRPASPLAEGSATTRPPTPS